MKRRTVLGGLGAAFGAAAVAGAGGLFAVQPRREWLVAPTDGDALPERVPGRPRAVVVGGGIAGITAAITLAVRGFAVTLVERGPDLGGKVAAWPVTVSGETFPLEHGFHGFFSQYYNLDEVLAEAGAQPADFVPQTSYPVLFPTGAPERFTNTTPIWPFNLASVIAGSERLRPAEFRDADGLLDLMRYRGAETYAAFDGVDFAQWIADRRIPAAMRDVVLRPFGDTTLNRTERLSAAEAIRFFHFYFLGNPEGLAFRALARDSGTAVVGPLSRRLTALGVEVLTGSPVRGLLHADGRITGVALDGPALAFAAAPSATLASADVGEDYQVVRVGGDAIAVARRPSGLVALDLRCTHQGCPVGVVDGGFRCPCHGGRFDLDGAPTQGPPRAPLARVQASEADGIVRIGAVGGGGGAARVLPCDACVVACDVRGLRSIVETSGLDPGWSRRVAALGESEPYAVARWWFDRPVDPSRSPFYTTTGFRYTDSLAVYSAFQAPYVDWAQRTGGSVVETHAYAIAPEDQADVDAITERLLAELRGILPELADARALHAEAQLQSNFSRWAPGDDATRPTTATPHPNLFVAGDHVKIDAPLALMEAAAASGRLAANGVLALYGARPVPIPIVSRRGVLA